MLGCVQRNSVCGPYLTELPGLHIYRIVMIALTGLNIRQGVFTARYNTLLVVQSCVARLAENNLKNS